MMGLLKLALGLKCGQAAPNPQLRSLNPHVRSPLRSQTLGFPIHSAAAITVGSGGVSSFGYSGTIAHAVLRHAANGRSLAVVPMAAHMYHRRTFAWLEVSKIPFAFNFTASVVNFAG